MFGRATEGAPQAARIAPVTSQACAAMALRGLMFIDGDAIAEAGALNDLEVLVDVEECRQGVTYRCESRLGNTRP